MTSIVESLTSLLTSRGASSSAPDPLPLVRQWTRKTALAVRRYEEARASGDDASSVAALRELGALLAAAPLDALDNLPGSVSRGQRPIADSVVNRIGTLLTGTRNQLDDDTARPSLADAQAALTEIAAGLDALSKRLRFTSGAAQLLKVAAYLLPIAAGYFIAVYFRFTGGGLYAENRAVLAPLLAYDAEPRATRLSFVPGFQKEFWSEFSRFYFQRPNEYTKLVNDGNVQLKLVFRNPRKADPLMVSTIETTARFTGSPFAWKNVDVTPRVEARHDDEAIELHDGGIGPALDFRYTVDSAKVRLIEGERKIVYRSAERVSLWKPTGDMTVVTSDDSRFGPTVYRRADGEFVSGIFDCPDGSRWEAIDQVARLDAVTPTVRGGQGTFAYSYESLRGERVTRDLTFQMPPRFTYFKRSATLTDKHPCEIPQPFIPPPVAPPDGGYLPNILDKLTPGTPSLKGVDLIIKRISIDLARTEDGRTTAGITTPDEILNPGGFLVVYLTLEHPKNGKVDVGLRVNGTSVQALTVPVLAPDRMHFDSSELAEERRRFASN